MTGKSAAGILWQTYLQQLSDIWTFGIENDFKLFLSPLFMRLKLGSLFNLQEHYYIQGFIRLIRSLPEAAQKGFLENIALDDLQLFDIHWQPNVIVLTYLEEPNLNAMAEYIVRYKQLLAETKLLRDEIFVLEQALELSPDNLLYRAQLKQKGRLLETHFQMPTDSVLTSIQNAKGSPIFSAVTPLAERAINTDCVLKPG
ncbi:hypothetical protein [Legionella genomosp. 1]|uniref:hypothetical protein n=1 Tax=Legionella genomosp. 1 TaxID=1093625 RepID=UPI001054E9EE|nr:hypothetical protein [Legionella genomosp. 1]